LAVPIEFISLVVQRAALDRVYPGGSEAFIKNHGPFDGHVQAYDDKLVKFGAMGSDVISDLADYLQKLGLTATHLENGEEFWADFCVVDQLFGPTKECVWLTYDRRTFQATALLA